MNLQETHGNSPCILLENIIEEKVHWLWQDRIPKNSLTIIEGDGGVGKSTILADLCSRLTTGQELPDDSKKNDPMKIVLIAQEDDPSAVLRPRFRVHRANMNFIYYWEGEFSLDPMGMQKLKEFIEETGVKVVVIDPVVSYLGRKVDMNKGNDVRSVLAPIITMARECDCTFIMVRHFNKSRDGLASHRGAGSVDFRNAARSTLQVVQDHSTKKSYLVLEKSNYAGSAKALPYKIHNSQVHWGVPEDITAQEIQNSVVEGGSSALYEAREFLKAELKDGPKRSKQLEEGIKEIGTSMKTLRRAKDQLGVVAKKVSNCWVWVLPEDKEGGQDGQGALGS